ncbi:MAG: hypothetical protein ACRD19_06900 [Terriglobia bacterium]
MRLWIVGALARMAETRLRNAEEFYGLAESHFQNYIVDLKKEGDLQPESYWNEADGFGLTRGEGLAGRREEIESLRDLNKYFGVIAVYTQLDHFLFMLFEGAKAHKLILDRKFLTKGYLTFPGYKRFLKETCEIDVEHLPFDYASLERLNAVRNAIAHRGGWIHDEAEKKRLGKYGFPNVFPLELPDDYFEASKKLVVDTCGLIAARFIEWLKNVQPESESPSFDS